MNWFSDLVEKLNPAQASIAAKEVTAAPDNIIEFEQAFREIEIIHRGVEMIINACVDVPWLIDGGGPVKKLNKLINKRPNPFEDRNRLFRRAFLDFILDGNAFFYYDGTFLFLLPANDVEIIPDEKTFVKRYEYLITTDSDAFSFTRSRNREKSSISFVPEEIIHIRSESDQSIYRGDSKLKSMERIIELYYTLISFQRQFFKNNAVPGIVLATDNVLSQKVKDRLLESWRMSYNTIFEGARSPAILDGGLKIDKFSNINFRELDFENSIERLQQDMAKALGVPFVLLKSGNNANINANQVLFYKHTILPMLNQFTSAFELFFGGTEQNLVLRPDDFSIPALQPDLKTQALFFSSLVNTGIITPNEAREKLRFEKIDDDECDKIRVPQNIAGSATNPSTGGRPSGDSEEESST